ncbi:MAG: YhgE/Pip domain-containing protein [Clostridiales bacterium]|nr:YhgE/Pip domain-containing protein [Candidatus Crickella caballi]
MNNIRYILRRDFKRIFTNWVAVVVLIGISILPSLYAWFNIAANMDPYENTSSIKIAVACLDAGVDEELVGQINVGETIVEELGKNETLEWVFLNEEESIEGVKAGEYYAAIVIPENFSATLTGFLHGKVDRPTIDYYVNEKLNAIAPKVTDTGSEVLQQTIDTKFKETVSTAIMKTMGETAGEIDSDISSKNSRLINSIDSARAAISDYRKTIESFHSTYEKSKALASDVNKLSGSANKSLKALDKVIVNNESIIDTVRKDTESAIADVEIIRREYPELEPIADKLRESLKDIKSALAPADEAMNKIKGLIAATGPTISQVGDMMNDMSDGLADIDKALASMSQALAATDSLLADARTSIYSLESAEALKDLRKVSGMDYEAMAEFMASPIQLSTERLYPVENYGSGVAPFFTMLAIWVGGLVLIAIFKLEVEVDPEEKRHLTMKEAYFARSLLFTIIGLVQALIVCAGDIWLLGIQCIHPLAFILAGLVASVVFVNLIFALTITFRHVGKALAVILVILQIPGSSGTYPVELTGSFFKTLYPILPFSYGVSSMREAIAGYYGSYYWKGLADLLVFLLVAYIIGLGIRPQMSPVNHTVDKRLNDTGILSSERDAQARESKAIKLAIKIANSDDQYQEEFDKRVASFEKFHAKVEDVGIRYVFIIPVVLLALVFIIPRKPLMITIWVICIIAVVAFLTFVEHTHVAIQERKYAKEVIADEERNSDI